MYACVRRSLANQMNRRQPQQITVKPMNTLNIANCQIIIHLKHILTQSEQLIKPNNNSLGDLPSPQDPPGNPLIVLPTLS